MAEKWFARRRRERPSHEPDGGRSARSRRARGGERLAVHRRAGKARGHRLRGGLADRRRRRRGVAPHRRRGELDDSGPPNPAANPRARRRSRIRVGARGTGRRARRREFGRAPGRGVAALAGRGGERLRRRRRRGNEVPVPRRDGRRRGRSGATGDGGGCGLPRRHPRATRRAHLRRHGCRPRAVDDARGQVRPQHDDAGVPGADARGRRRGGKRARRHRDAARAAPRQRPAQDGRGPAAHQGAQRADAQGLGALPEDLVVHGAASAPGDASRLRRSRPRGDGEVPRARREVPHQAHENPGGDAQGGGPPGASAGGARLLRRPRRGRDQAPRPGGRRRGQAPAHGQDDPAQGDGDHRARRVRSHGALPAEARRTGAHHLRVRRAQPEIDVERPGCPARVHAAGRAG